VPKTSSATSSALIGPGSLTVAALGRSRVVGLRLVYMTIYRLFAWLRLSRRSESWKTAEILLLRHQLTVLHRQVEARPKMSWSDRALIALLLDVIPKQQRTALRLIVAPQTARA